MLHFVFAFLVRLSYSDGMEKSIAFEIVVVCQ